MTDKNTKIVLGALFVLIIAVVAYAALTTPDTRTTGERVGDAVDQLDNGVDDAARELERRTPAERIEDEINDARE